MNNSDNFNENVQHLEFRWKNKWRHLIGHDIYQKVTEIGKPFMYMAGGLLEASNVDEQTARELGEKFAYLTHLSFVSGIEFGKMVGPVDPDAINTDISAKAAYNASPMGMPLMKQLSASFVLSLFPILDEKILQPSQDEVIKLMSSTFVNYFKTGLLISAHI